MDQVSRHPGINTKSKHFSRQFLSLCALCVLCGECLCFAGDLNPPAGAVSPTHKTLTEVEPRIAINAANTPGDADSQFKITQKGSYYLTGNITGVIGKHGIEIAASGVTVDLNGFDLLGLASLGGVIVTLGNQNNIAVLNGSVRNWGDGGVNLGTATNCRVEGVLVSGSTGATDGISTSAGCTVTNCSAYQNTGNGIFTTGGCTITHCSASNNAGHGISTFSGSTVTHCSARQNTGSGINTGDGCTITAFSAFDNTGAGIGAGTGCTITACSVGFNTLDGIRVTADCTVRGNTCDNNGFNGDGAGVHATTEDNRIEGNHCTDNDRGIDVDAAGNIIIRNKCATNTTNYAIAIGNSFGPIILAGTNAVAINGSTAAGTLSSTDPWANFAY